MKTVRQDPTQPEFVQNPYAFYSRFRETGSLCFWTDYGMPVAFDYQTVHTLLRDRRFGREVPSEFAEHGAAHIAPWLEIEAHSLLEAEPPRHTRLRALVKRAFTSRAVAAMEPEIAILCHALIDAFPDGEFDLLDAYCTHVPVITICRLLGVPEEMAPHLLDWSHAMVAMYQANRSRQIEDRAAEAAREFALFLKSYINERRADPRDDLITRLIAAEEDGARLSTDELIATCILLLNAGHEATVHTLGNGVKALLESGAVRQALAQDRIDATVEEILRYDPPLHMFTRYAYEEVEVSGHLFSRGDQVGLMLGAANRDPEIWTHPDRFDTSRPVRSNAALGGGLHFCVGAPLARQEMRIALPLLFERCPNLRLSASPSYADSYHFHGLEKMLVDR